MGSARLRSQRGHGLAEALLPAHSDEARKVHGERDQTKFTSAGAPSTGTAGAAPTEAGSQERLFKASLKAFPEGSRRQAQPCGSRCKPGFAAGLPGALCLPRGFQRPPGPGGLAAGEPRPSPAPPGAAHAALFALPLFTHTNLKHLPRFLRKLLHSDEVAAAVIKTQLITYPLNCNDRILSIW